MTLSSLVTIGLPFYNNEATLSIAIRSVLAQSYSHWELLLFDDGSTDNSLAMAQLIFDERIHLVSDGQNLGLASRLNQIANLAKGDFIVRFDADDVMHPSRIDHQIRLLQANPRFGLVSSGMYVVDSDSKPIGKRRSTRQPRSGVDVLRGRSISHPTVTGRTDWFRQNPYDPRRRRTEDFDLWVRTFDSVRHQAMPELLHFYRDDRFSLQKYQIAMAETREVIVKFGPTLVGWREATLLQAKSLAKESCAILAAKMGLSTRLLAARNEPLSQAELVEARDVLAALEL